jgi:hemerythrin-like domain-containing protein
MGYNLGNFSMSGGNGMRVKDPILHLRQEHDHALAALDRLERGAVNLGSAADALQIIQDALQFVDFEMRRHNEREEKVLFPRLGDKKGPIEAMLQEHRDLWETLDRLQGDVHAAIEHPLGGGPYYDVIRKESLGIVSLLREHIDKENQVLFRVADEFLSPEVKAEMAGEMERLLEEEVQVTNPTSGV